MMMPPFIKIKTGVVNITGCLIAAISFLIGIVIVVSCYGMYRSSCEYEERAEERMIRQDSIRAEFYSQLDSIYAVQLDSNDDMLPNSDNVQALILARLRNLEAKQETIMSDCRQETNNIINKVNGWIGFWIAILALFGGIIPIIIQYVLNHKTKLEYDCILNEISNKTVNNQMQLHVSTLWVDKTCSVLGNTRKSDNLSSLLTIETIKSLNSLLENLEDGDSIITESSKVHIINAMVQCYRLLDILKMRKDGRQTRRLNKLQNQVRTIIEDLMDLHHHRADEIIGRLHDLITNLYGVNA